MKAKWQYVLIVCGVTVSVAMFVTHWTGVSTTKTISSTPQHAIYIYHDDDGDGDDKMYFTNTMDITETDFLTENDSNLLTTTAKISTSRMPFSSKHSKHSISEPKHWVPDWATETDLGKLLPQRKANIQARCKELSPYKTQWRNRPRPLYVNSRSAKLCATAKGGSTFWKEYFRNQRRSEKRSRKSPKKKVKFVVIRNPWHRLVSAWNDKLTGGTKFQWMKRFCQKKWDDTPPFSVFVEECVIKNWRRKRNYNIHYVPVIDRCRVCNENKDFDFYIALENMNNEAVYMLENYAGVLHASDMITTSRNASIRSHEKKQVTASYQQQYVNVSQANIDTLRTIYQYEIFLFGYPDTPFVDFVQS